MRTGLFAIFVALLVTGCTTPTVIPTPIPTAVPTPAPIVAAVPTKDDALLRYKLKVTPLVTDLGSSLNQMAAATPSNFSDAASQSKYKAALGTFSGALTDIRIGLGGMEAPRTARPFHACFTETVDMLADGTLKMQVGVSVGDNVQLVDGAKVMQAAQTRWTECGKIFVSQLQ